MTPDGPLSGSIYDIYVSKLRRQGFDGGLDEWIRNGEKRRIFQDNRVLPNGLCQRCDDIASNDLERLESLRLEDSQIAVIRLAKAKADTRCQSYRFFARWGLDGSKDQARDYFLVSLAAVNLDLRPALGRLCFVTNDPGFSVSHYKDRNDRLTEHLIVLMDTVRSCSQNGNRNLFFGQDEYESISQWLRTCMADHSTKCPQNSVRSAVTVYCIDCEDGKVVPMPPNAKYFALSYVWGDAKAPDDNELLSDAPPVVKDAMVATL